MPHVRYTRLALSQQLDELNGRWFGCYRPIYDAAFRNDHHHVLMVIALNHLQPADGHELGVFGARMRTTSLLFIHSCPNTFKTSSTPWGQTSTAPSLRIAKPSSQSWNDLAFLTPSTYTVIFMKIHSVIRFSAMLVTDIQKDTPIKNRDENITLAVRRK